MEYPRAHQWKVGRQTETQINRACADLSTQVGQHWRIGSQRAVLFQYLKVTAYASNRGRQKPWGPTPGFWEVALGRRPRMWMQRSVIQPWPQSWHYSDPKPSSPLSPSEARTDVWASLSSPPKVALTPAFSVSRTQELDSYQDLCAPTNAFPQISCTFPKGFTFSWLPKSILYSSLRLMFLIERIESRRNVSLKRHLGPFFHSSLSTGMMMMPPLNMPANPCPQRSHKNNLETQGFTQLEVSIVFCWAFSPVKSVL